MFQRATQRPRLGSLSSSVFERRTSTGSGLFVSLGSGLVQTLGQIVFIREKKLSNANLLESRHIKEKKASLPVDVRRSKTSLLKLPNRVFERRTSTGSGLFAFLGGGFSYIFEQIVFVRVKTLSITNLAALRYFKRRKPHFRLTLVGECSHHCGSQNQNISRRAVVIEVEDWLRVRLIFSILQEWSHKNVEETKPREPRSV